MAIPAGRSARSPSRTGLLPAASSAGPSLNKGGSLTRRSFLAGGLGLGLAGAAPGGAAQARAAAPAVPFGAAIQAEYFDLDPYRQAFLDHCDLIVPMNELKFSMLRPSRDEFDFGPADRLVDFARRNGRLSRGHTFVWWGATPEWLEAITGAAEAERELVHHIQTTADRYRGRLTGWDVVNEVIAHEPRESGPLRDTYWLRTMGPRHIPVAFEAAAAADPSARLVLNDYDLEFMGDRYDARRDVALSLVRQLQDGNVPIAGVGIQAHLYSHLRIDVEALGNFGEALKRLGVRLLVTELDLIDWEVRGGAAEQDAAAEKIVGDLLDGVLAAGPPEAVVTWGITDRYSWIPDVMPRSDGNPERPLPLDRDYRPKAWYELLRRRLAEVA